MESDPFNRITPENSYNSDKSDKKEKSKKKEAKAERGARLFKELGGEKVADGEKPPEDRKRGFFETEKDKKEAKEDNDKASENEPTVQELAKEYVDQRGDSLRAELKATTDSAKRTELTEDIVFVDELSEKITDPEADVEEEVQEAYDDLMAALSETEGGEETDEAPEDEARVDELATEEAEDIEETKAEEAESDDDDSSTTTTTAYSSSATPGSPTTSSTTTSSSSSPPPPPPKPTATPPPPPIPPTPPPIGPTSSSSAAAAPPVPSPGTGYNRYPSGSYDKYDRRRHLGGLLVAGAVGYMIGRRGGRKRTEAKLNPEIKKQKTEIKDLKKDIEQKEHAIRTAVSQRAQQNQENLPKTVVEKEAATEPKYKQPSTVLSHEKTPKPPQNTSEETEKTVGTAPIAIEKSAKAEKAPKFMPIPTPLPKIERAPNLQDQAIESKPTILPIEKRIETASTQQLLHISEGITILDTTVKRLYETNQINRKGLEAIVIAHLKHKDVGKELDKHLKGREAINERAREFKHDPATQDDATDDISTSGTTKKDAKLMPEHTLAANGLKSLSGGNRDSTLAERLSKSLEPIQEPEPPTLQGIKEQPSKHTSIWAIIAVAGICIGIAYGIFYLFTSLF